MGGGPNRKQIIDALRNTAQSASNMVAENASVPVDTIAWALRKAGVPVGDKPVMGSDWMRDKGLTRPVEEGVTKMIGDTIGLVGPLGMSKSGASAMIEAGKKLKGLPVGMSIRDVSPNTVWYRGQSGAKSAENPFDSTIRQTPSFADSPAIASEYAINPNAAGNYGILGAPNNVAGASVHPFTTSGKVWDLNEFQGGHGTQTGITQENLIKIAKEIGVDPASLTDELLVNFTQKWGKGKNAYWDSVERGSNSKNRIMPAYTVAENPTLLEAARKKGLDSIQFKGAVSDANAYDASIPWNEKITHQELRPLNRNAIKSTFESNK